MRSKTTVHPSTDGTTSLTAATTLSRHRASFGLARAENFTGSRTLETFPHGSRIESSVGQSIPGNALVNQEACSLLNVPAFTRGQTTYFKNDRPSLKVAAHEAAHLYQHGARTRDMGMGAELHAEVLANRISRGEPAEEILTQRGRSIPIGVRPYTLIPVAEQEADKWNAGKDLKVADDGNLAAGAEIDPHNHDLWAKPALVSTSNGILAAKHSVIRLKTEGDTLKGPAPDKSGPRTLTRIMPENQVNGTSGDSMKIWCDCGRAGRDVMGAGEGTGGHGQRMTADYTGVHRPWYASIPILGPLLSWIFGGEKKEKKQTAASSPEAMKKEIFNERLGGTGDEGMKKYERLAPPEKEKFDKETGINRFAAPGVGQGFTMSTGGAPAGSNTWNFHWAGVVMVSGGDRVTLENYATGDPGAENVDWDFGLYGPPSKPGQTFYEEHKATGQHGTSPTAMQVETR